MRDSYRAADANATSRRSWLGQALLVFASTRAVLSVEPPPSASVPARLPRDRLLLYRNRAGKLREATSRAQWLRRRADILRGFESIAGTLPGRERRCPLDVQVDEEVDAGTFVRRAIRYQSEPGGQVPAYLLIPKSALAGQRCPAALCLHQTHPEGRKVVVGLGNSPDDEYGVELAQRGFVCLAPPYPLLSDYQPDILRLGYASGTMKAIWDNVRGLDLLQSLPFVRRNAIVAIGHSLGGHNAIFTAVMDPRIQAVVTSCAFDSFVDYMGGNIAGWNQVRYMPRLKDYLGRPAEIPFDFHELVGALAPRGLFASAPIGDSNFRWQSVDRIARAAQPVYALYHAEKSLVVRHPECQHRFPPELRQEAYAFLDAQLAPIR